LDGEGRGNRGLAEARDRVEEARRSLTLDRVAEIGESFILLDLADRLSAQVSLTYDNLRRACTMRSPIRALEP